MEYHFYKQQPETGNRKVDVKRVFLYFMPVFLMAGILPLLVGLVKRPTDVSFNAEASNNSLSVWTEPANVQITHGTPVTLSVFAHFDSESKLLPGVRFPVDVSGPAAIEYATINYQKPFRGRVLLGQVKIVPQREGTVTVSINPKAVVSQTFPDPLQVSVSSTVIEVR